MDMFPIMNAQASVYVFFPPNTSATLISFWLAPWEYVHLFLALLSGSGPSCHSTLSFVYGCTNHCITCTRQSAARQQTLTEISGRAEAASVSQSNVNQLHKPWIPSAPGVVLRKVPLSQEARFKAAVFPHERK